MKDFITLIVILMLIVGIGLWQINYLEETSRYLRTDLEYIKYSIDLEKFEESEERIIIFNTTWKNLREVWGIFVHHDDILEIESSIAEIEACIENNDKDDVKIRIDRLISNITAVAEREKINIENIF